MLERQDLRGSRSRGRQALKEAGAKLVYLSGAFKEFGDDAAEAEKVIDGRIYLGMDVVDVLTATLDTLGVAK